MPITQLAQELLLILSLIYRGYLVSQKNVKTFIKFQKLLYHYIFVLQFKFFFSVLYVTEFQNTCSCSYFKNNYTILYLKEGINEMANFSETIFRRSFHVLEKR